MKTRFSMSLARPWSTSVSAWLVEVASRACSSAAALGVAPTRPALTGFYPWLTRLRPSGNHGLRSVCPMSPQHTPTADREDDHFLGLGVRPGESDPARMLAGVLLLVVATVLITLALAWWLL